MIQLLLASFAIALASPVDEGAYLARAASCRECHTPLDGKSFSGGAAVITDFGTFYTPNITPDPRTGIGNWSEADFLKAMRDGISPAGTYYFPSFPFRAFSKMTDDDIAKIFAYLRVQPAVEHRVRPHDLWWPIDHRALNRLWQWSYFKSKSSDLQYNIKAAVGPFKPDPKMSVEWNRGAYLTEAVLHCAECHTPRDSLGGPEVDQWMAGSDLDFSGHYPPNITPDLLSGIRWSRAQWFEFLSSGIDPDGNTPAVEMALAVRAASGLTNADRNAVVNYLISLKPITRYSKGRK